MKKNAFKTLLENWDGNTVFKYDLGDKMGYLNILTNADRKTARYAVTLFENHNADADADNYKNIEDFFSELGFVAITALHTDSKELTSHN